MNDESIDNVCKDAKKLMDATGWYKTKPLYECVLNQGLCPNPKESNCFTRNLYEEMKVDGTAFNPLDDYRR